MIDVFSLTNDQLDQLDNELDRFNDTCHARRKNSATEYDSEGFLKFLEANSEDIKKSYGEIINL